MSKLNPTRQALAEAIAARTEAEKAVEAAVAAENDALGSGALMRGARSTS